MHACVQGSVLYKVMFIGDDIELTLGCTTGNFESMMESFRR